MKRQKPMKRSGFSTPTGILATSSFVRKKEPGRKMAMKPARPKMTPIRRSARGQQCELRIAGVCNGDPDTTVLCHSNALADGKGLGLKAPDTAACYGCSACHDVLDGRAPRPDWLTRDMLLALFSVARVMTHKILREKGLME